LTGAGEIPSVALEGVSKRFGELLAVDDLSLELERGEFFTLLGPSGCGKTTTLRMIAGFERPSEGAIRIEGEDVAELPPHRRPTNTVFQSYALFPHLSVEDNVAFGLKRKGVAKGEIAGQVKAELERVGLTAEANRRPAQLSGGMQQRVALARALVNLPKVLLLDEPLGALDLKLRKGLQVELKRIQREVGITFVYVTHDQEEALTMSDRIAVMNRGRVEQVAGPEDVYERPETTFVAGFIGVSNLMPASVVGPGRVQLDNGPGVEADTGSLGGDDVCHVVVRPEKLRVELAGEGAAAANGLPRVEGVVESSLYLGTATQITVGLGEEVRMTVLVPNADESERQRLPGGGARVELSWAPEHMHLVRESPSGAGSSGGRGSAGGASGGLNSSADTELQTK
jgi:spermidine/putrescine transport system ATP-binding protein